MTDTPTLWRDMTPEEKGALLLAEHEGKAIEIFGLAYPDAWYETDPYWDNGCAYRIKPEPKRETVEIWVGEVDGFWEPYEYLDNAHKITFAVIDGKPDPESIKIEEM